MLNHGATADETLLLFFSTSVKIVFYPFGFLFALMAEYTQNGGNLAFHFHSAKQKVKSSRKDVHDFRRID